MSNEQELPEKATDEQADVISAQSASAQLDSNVDDSSQPQAAQKVNVEELSQKLEEAEQKATENWDKVLRIQAEMENLKRRTQKDLENAHKFALENFAKELLTVVDSLELGLQAAIGDSPEVQKFREGSELTLKQFEAVFSKFNIEVVNPLGQPFDPELHQAMAMQPSADAEPNSVINVFQKGYVLNGRLLRPAMVVVAKADDNPPQETPKIDEQA
ncbi:nucleotide exchange factor GrpE [Methylotuvimicrobium buryatense]|uniref:Protein GrpE n=1 Tax=Methylotuvimicrobium buryatense TaxID=95641 RepID=A0A4V1IJW3_METBY|nr:nucleotide exchange factor GrpE [Methylotuvimicrobium buryatense]QCW82805.1 nucleotide exchange factor GrpE [Methylotuvimicrobium buryatense]